MHPIILSRTPLNHLCLERTSNRSHPPSQGADDTENKEKLLGQQAALQFGCDQPHDVHKDHQTKCDTYNTEIWSFSDLNINRLPVNITPGHELVGNVNNGQSEFSARLYKRNIQERSRNLGNTEPQLRSWHRCSCKYYAERTQNIFPYIHAAQHPLNGSKNSPLQIKLESSLPCSQEPAICPCPASD
jgi:hypothetical protein